MSIWQRITLTLCVVLVAFGMYHFGWYPGAGGTKIAGVTGGGEIVRKDGSVIVTPVTTRSADGGTITTYPNGKVVQKTPLYDGCVQMRVSYPDGTEKVKDICKKPEQVLAPGGAKDSQYGRMYTPPKKAFVSRSRRRIFRQPRSHGQRYGVGRGGDIRRGRRSARRSSGGGVRAIVRCLKQRGVRVTRVRVPGACYIRGGRVKCAQGPGLDVRAARSCTQR